MGDEKVFISMDREMQLHECPWPTYHIETPNRLKVILDRIETKKLLENPKIEMIPTRLAGKDELETIHTSRYINDIELSENMTTEQQEALCTNYEDIYVNKHTWKCAKMAAASAIDLVDKVTENPGSSGISLVRPPGHHAMPDQGCGFCIFNNVALAAKVQSKKNKKVLIVDIDVHAAQGTQECIDGDENIRLISIHRYEHGTFWPNLEQSGVVHKYKNTQNIPLNGTSFTDSDYITIFHSKIMPIIYEYIPDVILVSCGFDAALGDPEGCMRVTPAGYATMFRMLMNTGLSVAAVLEGGYFLDSIASDAEYVLKTMLGEKVPCVDLKPVDDRLATVLDSFEQEDGKCFTQGFGNTIRKDAEDLKFLGNRTVCIPYETRGIYEPFSDEKIENFRKELNEVIEKYEDPSRKYQDFQIILVENEDEIGIETSENICILKITKKYETLAIIHIIHPKNPLFPLPKNWTTIEKPKNCDILRKLL